jgi:hypothetical protein
MQIGPHRLLSFLPGSTQPQPAATGDANEPHGTGTSTNGAAKSRADAPPEPTAAPQDASAILHIQPQTSPSVAPPGDLVYAKPAKPAAGRAPDFVTFAVSAMREYADEQERLKTAAAKAEDGATGATRLPRSLVEVQKLAARFKLFA